MTFVVPFDGSPLAEAALAKASLYAIALEESAGTLEGLLPESRSYAREKGWVGEDEEFAPRRAVERLHRQVSALAPNAGFQFERVDAGATPGTISTRLRRTAHDLDASDVFVGSENAGRIVTPLSSAGSGVAADERYDVTIVRKPLPRSIERRLKSDFFV